MLKGIHVSLLIGPVVPIPVSQEVLDALTNVQVISSTDDKMNGFELTFVLSTRSPLHTIFLLSAGSPIPLIRVVIAVVINGTTEVLMDGVMTQHEIKPGTDAAHTTLIVKGKDLTAVMDYLEFNIPYPAMPAEARVTLMLAKYLPFGVIPLVIPSILVDVPIPVERIPNQRGTDLNYIRWLAKRVGYVFYMEPGPAVGTSLAYWGPEIKVGVPQPALNINMDAHTNVDSMSFTFDTERRTLPIIYLHNKETKAIIPIPVLDITPLNPPLGLIPPIPMQTKPVRGMAKYSPVEALLIGVAKAAKSSDAVKGTGSLDVLRYGRVLKARKLVGVRGAGPAFDGLHYVTSVTHAIKRGEYKQNFTLSRNGLISTLPEVPA
ncbi:MAG: hypothetical protein KF722_11020 [Nitrospira sp.]|nr:hypothetical protein [Nitrospira sp.]